MNGFDGVDVRDVITQVKYALFVAQSKVGQQDLGYKFGGVDIELKVVETRDATGKPVFKVPVLDWEIGPQLKIAQEQIQTISLSLAPIPKGQEALRAEPFDIPLTEALLEVAAIATFARQEEPKLALGDSSIEFQFGYTKDGKVTLLIFEGHMARATTHTLKVKLAKA
jgi:hypothetical protein